MNRVFIVGVMKSGTTVLFENMAMHPLIEPAKSKEVNYYSLKLHLGESWYKEQYSHIDNSVEYTIDASPTYFTEAQTNSVIPSLIKRDFPDAKIIVIYRDPIDRAISHFNHLQKVNKIESLISISTDEFFNYSYEKSIFPDTDVFWYLNRVLQASNYLWPSLMYESIFEKDQILYLDREDLFNSPFETMSAVFKFLGLSDYTNNNFSKVRYSLGSRRSQLSKATEQKLQSLLYPQFDKFLSKIKKSRSRVDSIIPGRDGFLFLRGGSNKLVEQYKKNSFFANECLEKWVELLKGRNRFLNKHGSDFFCIVVPNKLSVYFELAENLGVHFDRSFSPLRLLTNKLQKESFYINILDVFLKKKEEYLLYWKSDSHWTYWGCYFAYLEICKKIGFAPLKFWTTYPYNEGVGVLDLGGKLIPPIKEKVKYYDFSLRSKLKFKNELVRYKEENSKHNDIGLHVGSWVTYSNPMGYEKKIAIFGDSFSEYRPHLLTGMLAETFKEVSFIWSSNLDYNFIKTYQPDIVIFQTVERFLIKVPNDIFNIEKFAAERLARVRKID